MLNIGKILEKIFKQLISEPLANEEVTTKNNRFMKTKVTIRDLNFIFDRNNLLKLIDS